VHPGGRPSKLRGKAVKTFLEHIKAGLTIEAATARAGVGRTTVFMWLQRGREAVRGEFRDFLNAYEEALGIAEATLIERLTEAGHQEPKIWMWILERRFPERWSLKERHELSGPGGGPLSIPASVSVTLKVDDKSFALADGQFQTPGSFNRS
jgi:hypothetical protein